MITVGSLFAGIGGIDLGLERTGGFKTVWQVEINSSSNAVRSRHWPNTPRYDDVTKFTLATDPVRPDLACGGFPCQDLSVAGKRAGLAGERSGLFHEFMRIVSERTPRWVLVENVPGLLSSWSGDTPYSLDKRAGRGRELVLEETSDFSVVLGTLAELGYGTAYRVLDAQWFGVAQRRRRVFIVGCLGDWRRAAEVLFEPESLPWNPAPSRETRKGVARSITGGAHPGGHNGQDDVNIVNCLDGQNGGPDDNDAQAMRLVAMPLKSGGNDRQDESHENYIVHTLRGEGFDASEDGTGRGTPIVPVVFDTTQVTSSKNYSNPKPGDPCHPLACGQHAPAIAYRTSGNCGVMEQGDRTAALNTATDPNQNIIAYQCHGSNVGPMGTVRAGNGNETGGVPFTISQNSNGYAWEGGDVNPTLQATPPSDTMSQQYGIREGMRVRRLTPIECERLQGFPDDWTRYGTDGKEISDSARYRMIGNAVCVPVAHWIGERILEAERA
jgi:DNA (cytosine-5)-methyltransferase 1